MRRFIILLAFLAAQAHADTVGLQFKSIAVPALIEAVMTSIVREDFVISPEVLAMPGALNLNVKAIDRATVVDFLRGLLAGEGVKIDTHMGVHHFSRNARAEAAMPPPAPAEREPGEAGEPVPADLDTDVVAYIPRHRPAELLALALKVAGVKLIDAQGKLDALVFEASPARSDKIKKLLDEIDRPVASVLVKVALIEVQKTSEESRSLTAALDLIGGKMGLTLNPGKSYPHALTFAGASLQAVLSAVDGDSRFRYLAEPQLKVVDGETARLVVGQDVPIRGATIIANNQTQQSIEYRTAGVVIEIEPRILRESMLIRLRQTVSDVMQTTTSGIDSPTMQKREAMTVVTAKHGELLMIAGMDNQKETRAESGLSFLPSFLNSVSSSKSDTQMLLLVEVQRLDQI